MLWSKYLALTAYHPHLPHPYVQLLASRPASPNPSLEKHSCPSQCPVLEAGGLAHHLICGPLAAGPPARSPSPFGPRVSQWLCPQPWSLSICPSELPEPVPAPAIFLAFTLEWLGYPGLAHSGPEVCLMLMAFRFLPREGPTLTQVPPLSDDCIEPPCPARFCAFENLFPKHQGECVITWVPPLRFHRPNYGLTSMFCLLGHLTSQQASHIQFKPVYRDDIPRLHSPPCRGQLCD